MSLVYVAVLRDPDLSVDQVLSVQTDKKKLEIIIMDYFGISETKAYTEPSKYLGYTKYEYSEFEDDIEGYHTFEDDGEIHEVYIYCKALDESC